MCTGCEEDMQVGGQEASALSGPNITLEEDEQRKRCIPLTSPAGLSSRSHSIALSI